MACGLLDQCCCAAGAVRPALQPYFALMQGASCLSLVASCRFAPLDKQLLRTCMQLSLSSGQFLLAPLYVPRSRFSPDN
ncbi:hypothetical protein ACGFNV_35695 [Streptomyces sp. NPDC048751]|uniref:hypothetical protein n=1 Tax=Streptomyces sp. NPDC048751 TaxID=3365591 RepID=UPI00371915A2